MLPSLILFLALSGTLTVREVPNFAPLHIDKEKTYDRPDGNSIAVGAERYHCAEVLLQPNLIDK